MAVIIRRKEGRKRWYLDICHKGMRCTRKGGDTFEEAEINKASAEHLLKTGRFKFKGDFFEDAKTRMTLTEYFEQKFLPTCGVKEKTMKSYKCCFKTHIDFHLGSLKLTEIDRDKVKGFVRFLMQIHFQRKEIWYKLSRDTIRVYCAVLRRVLNEAIEDGQRWSILLRLSHDHHLGTDAVSMMLLMLRKKSENNLLRLPQLV